MVCTLADKICNTPRDTSISPPLAYEFGKTHSQFRLITKCMMVFFAFLVVLGALLIAGFSSSTSAVTEGALFATVGGLGMLFTAWGMRRVEAANERVKQALKDRGCTDLEERYFWRVGSTADELSSASQDNEKVALSMQFGKVYGTAYTMTQGVALIFVCALVIGIYAATRPELQLSYAACFTIAGLSIIPMTYGANRVYHAKEKVKQIVEPQGNVPPVPAEAAAAAPPPATS